MTVREKCCLNFVTLCASAPLNLEKENSISGREDEKLCVAWDLCQLCESGHVEETHAGAGRKAMSELG